MTDPALDFAALLSHFGDAVVLERRLRRRVLALNVPHFSLAPSPIDGFEEETASIVEARAEALRLRAQSSQEGRPSTRQVVKRGRYEDPQGLQRSDRDLFAQLANDDLVVLEEADRQMANTKEAKTTEGNEKEKKRRGGRAKHYPSTPMAKEAILHKLHTSAAAATKAWKSRKEKPNPKNGKAKAIIISPDKEEGQTVSKGMKRLLDPNQPTASNHERYQVQELEDELDLAEEPQRLEQNKRRDFSLTQFAKLPRLPPRPQNQQLPQHAEPIDLTTPKASLDSSIPDDFLLFSSTDRFQMRNSRPLSNPSPFRPEPSVPWNHRNQSEADLLPAPFSLALSPSSSQISQKDLFAKRSSPPNEKLDIYRSFDDGEEDFDDHGAQEPYLEPPSTPRIPPSFGRLGSLMGSILTEKLPREFLYYSEDSEESEIGENGNQEQGHEEEMDVDPDISFSSSDDLSQSPVAMDESEEGNGFEEKRTNEGDAMEVDPLSYDVVTNERVSLEGVPSKKATAGDLGNSNWSMDLRLEAEEEYAEMGDDEDSLADFAS